MYLLGYDIGSSTIKVALIQADTRRLVGQCQYPDQEMDMIARQRGWAEQQPELWWQNCCVATQRLLAQTGVATDQIKGIGIGYQMHGLVLIDKDQQVLRPAIIWCDSRAVSIGEQAFRELGEASCLNNWLNSPGNFTASKLKWVKDNEPDLYEKIDKVLLPGDYIAMKLTGRAVTTVSGLTEGILWNFKEHRIAKELLAYYDLDENLIPEQLPTFSIQGRVSKIAATRAGLSAGIPVTYRAGDQPNNALALNVLHPGEIAATSGASGVVYGIVDRPVFDPRSRVNSFAHVNYGLAHNRIGVLLCLNGAGKQYSWIKDQISRSSHTYADMERMAASVPIGADGLCILPFGNGSERMLENQEPNAHIVNLQFNRHTRGHLYRAALEGVAFSFAYGIKILQELGLEVDVIRVGNDDMFQSHIFSTTLATLLDCEIEVLATNGAIGAAKAAGIAAGLYADLDDALAQQSPLLVYQPSFNQTSTAQAYAYWKSWMKKSLTSTAEEQKARPAATDESQRLTRELKEKNRDLAAAALKLTALKDKMDSLQKRVEALTQHSKDNVLTPALIQINQEFKKQLDTEAEWQTFEEHFDLLHRDFFSRLKADFPQLSVAELKMCACLQLELSNKEIARRLNLSVRGVETRRYRLGKKLNLAQAVKLVDFLRAY